MDICASTNIIYLLVLITYYYSEQAVKHDILFITRRSFKTYVLQTDYKFSAFHIEVCWQKSITIRAETKIDNY